mmetsp:Transcript_35115/g.111798  ORF Transcript_35115/g.111798 Transcript_35115/m.111798 type:complete len:230 (-) Transcript_35115:836-1525(-)
MQQQGASTASAPSVGPSSPTVRVGSRAIWPAERPVVTSPMRLAYSIISSYSSPGPPPPPTGMPASSCCSITICCPSSVSSFSCAARRTRPRDASPSTSNVPRGASPAARSVVSSSDGVPNSRRGKGTRSTNGPAAEGRDWATRSATTRTGASAEKTRRSTDPSSHRTRTSEVVISGPGGGGEDDGPAPVEAATDSADWSAAAAADVEASSPVGSHRPRRAAAAPTLRSR